MKPIAKNILIFAASLIVLGGLLSFYDSSWIKKPEERGVNNLVQSINEEKVSKLEIKGDTVTVFLSDGSSYFVRKEPGTSLSELVKNYSIDPAKITKVSQNVKDESGMFWVGTILPMLVPLVLVALFIYFMFRQVQGANSRAMMFGMSRAREFDPKASTVNVTFKDVAGVKEAKQELEEVVEFLKEPKKFLAMGAKIPRGVLLMGAPGTGKTLLARAVAGEAGVSFLFMSASEFGEMFVGVGASRVRDLFDRAKKMAPCIIFIDEIDAVGRMRGMSVSGGRSEDEQTLNQILTEMDGFEPNSSVIILAATNRPDVLDPALLRPGRFDRRVMLNLPNIADREEIMKVHAANKPLAPDIDMHQVASRTPGFSGADLANLLNEAAILAARRNDTVITKEDVLTSIEKVMLGPERKNQMMSEKEKKITAYHEGGHALVGHHTEGASPVQKISVISRGQAAGYTINMPMEDKYFHTKSEFVAEMAVMLGGYAAEEIIFGEVTTGAHNDLQKATNLAKKLITDYGMSESMSPRTFGNKEDMMFIGREAYGQRDYSEKTAEVIDHEVEKLIKQARETAQEVIKKHRSKLEAVVQSLLEKETIEREEFVKLMA